jgi:hypothetical protein
MSYSAKLYTAEMFSVKEFANFLDFERLAQDCTCLEITNTVISHRWHHSFVVRETFLQLWRMGAYPSKIGFSLATCVEAFEVLGEEGSPNTSVTLPAYPR